MPDLPLLRVDGLSKFYGQRIGCVDVSFELWPGEVLGPIEQSLPPPTPSAIGWATPPWPSPPFTAIRWPC